MSVLVISTSETSIRDEGFVVIVDQGHGIAALATVAFVLENELLGLQCPAVGLVGQTAT